MKPFLPLVVALAASVSFPALAQNALEMGRERSEAFLAGTLAPIWEDMTADMRSGLGSLENFSAFRDRVAADLGEEEAVLDEKTSTEGDFSIYLRASEWSSAEVPILMQWVFDAEGGIAGFFVQPQPVAAESAHLDYTTRADLRLPFDGEWFVFWGGRDIEDNYHAANAAQRFAYDFLVLEDGRSYEGNPQALESYHCWGRDILAPADGEVVATVTDLPDQPIGGSDPENPAGNHVVLDLGNGEFAFLDHMRQGSVSVQPGDSVARGEVLGLCGNSGNTSEPHLHFHLQTTPDLFAGEGLPAQFEDYVTDGQPTERGEPVKGQTIAPAAE